MPPESPPAADRTLFREVTARIGGKNLANPPALIAETFYVVDGRFRATACDRTPRVRIEFMQKHADKDGERRANGGIALSRLVYGRAVFRGKVRTPREPGLYELRLSVLPPDLEKCDRETTGVIYSTVVAVVGSPSPAAGATR